MSSDLAATEEVGRFETYFGTAIAVRARYRNGTTAIHVHAAVPVVADVREIGSLSVNLVGASYLLNEDEFFVARSGTEGREHLLNAALESGLFEDTGRRGPLIGQGSERARIWKVRRLSEPAKVGWFRRLLRNVRDAWDTSAG